MAVQSPVRPDNSGVDMVCLQVPLHLVFYSEQPQAHLWRDGRGAQKRNA